MAKKSNSKYQPKDALDLEVDQLLKMAKDKRFEPGIYNYCDRWCEKCADTAKCFLFAEDELKQANKLLSGQTDDEEENWLKDMEHSFAITHRLLERQFKELGMDWEKVSAEADNIKSWDDDARERYKNIPCHKLARKYMKETSNFLNKFHEDRHKYYASLGMAIDYSDIKDEIETINWYYTMLPVKIWRYFYEKESLAREKDAEFKEMMAEDLKKFQALVEKCLNKSLAAWEKLGQKRKDQNLNCKLFIDSLKKIKQEFKKKNYI